MENGHVAIYIGGGQCIGCQDSGVDYFNIYSDYYINRYSTARRLIDPDEVIGYIGCKTFMSLPIMSSPSTSSTRLGTYYTNETYNIIDESGDWWQTQYGWIQKIRYSPLSSVPIMNTPSTSGTRVGTYYTNETFTFISQEGDWWQTIYGWIHVMHFTSFATTPIMNSPSDSATRIGTYSGSGENFVVISENSDWWQTQHGYIRKVKYTPTSDINIMDIPSTSGTVRGAFHPGETFVIIGQSGDWWQTLYGYVKKSDVTNLNLN